MGVRHGGQGVYSFIRGLDSSGGGTSCQHPGPNTLNGIGNVLLNECLRTDLNRVIKVDSSLGATARTVSMGIIASNAPKVVGAVVIVWSAVSKDTGHCRKT